MINEFKTAIADGVVIHPEQVEYLFEEAYSLNDGTGCEYTQEEMYDFLPGIHIQWLYPFVTELVERGNNLKAVKQLLGMKDEPISIEDFNNALMKYRATLVSKTPVYEEDEEETVEIKPKRKRPANGESLTDKARPVFLRMWAAHGEEVRNIDIVLAVMAEIGMEVNDEIEENRKTKNSLRAMMVTFKQKVRRGEDP